MDLPKPLLDAVADGTLILFLGAGASIGSITEDGQEAPAGPKLAKMLSEKFLGYSDDSSSLASIAEYAESETDLLTLQTYIKEVFEPLNPAPFHKILPSFKWSGIVTTNYDLIIEKSYNQFKNPKQKIVPFYRNIDRVDKELRTDEALPFIKLHGCVSKFDDIETPLILTNDQYITHRNNRSKLFDRFTLWASEYPVLFIGHNLEDPDLRKILIEVSKAEFSRPRFFAITPNPTDIQKRFWEGKKITILKGTFEEFINEIDDQLDKTLRTMSLPKIEHPILRHYPVKNPSLSDSAANFLKHDTEFIDAKIPCANHGAELFYKGLAEDWEPVIKGYDCKRKITDTALSDLILVDDIDRPSGCDFYVLKGHAGSGKSIVLKRLAWDAANTFDKVCLWIKRSSTLTFAPLLEILDSINERIFLFIDKPSEIIKDLHWLVTTSRKRKYQLTIIVAERTNEWNTECGYLDDLINEVFKLGALDHHEINDLLLKLTQHKSLGILSKLSKEAQVAAFKKKAGRQLLVALYEATSGRPYKDIIFDEFSHITPELAKLIYLSVCAFNRLEVPVRAGFIKRLHGVSFEEFEKDFFRPLESVVYTKEDHLKDHAYYSRHPWIAETVFELALASPDDRLDFYLKVLDSIDIGYDADRAVYRNIIKAKELLALFNDPLKVKQIYEKAKEFANSDAYFHHQLGLYEMKRANPNFDLSYKELIIAEKLETWNKSIKHSIAELELERARRSTNAAETDRHLSNATRLASSLKSHNGGSYGYHTLIKISLERLNIHMKSDSVKEDVITALSKDVEKSLAEGMQTYPDDEYLLLAESDFAKLFQNDVKATLALEKANRINPGGVFIARRLSKHYENIHDIEKAKDVLGKCLDRSPNSKEIRAALAMLLSNHFPNEKELAEYHWQRSFTEGDTNYLSQFWYARQLFLNDKKQEAATKFASLKTTTVPSKTKFQIRGPILETGTKSIKSFTGRIERIESGYMFVSSVIDIAWLFAHYSKSQSKNWAKLTLHDEVTFKIGFNFKGPSAFDLMLKTV